MQTNSYKTLRIVLAVVMVLSTVFATLSPAGIVKAATYDFTVDTLVDENDGECTLDCTLREATYLAVDGDVIGFSVSGTITLTSDIFFADGTSGSPQAITIDGGNNITVSGGGNTRIFSMNPFNALTLIDIVLTNGNYTNGGAIAAYGSLTLDGVTISNNNSTSGAGVRMLGGYGDLISLNITDSTFDSNIASVYAGAILALNADINISNTAFVNNEGGPNCTSGCGAGGMLIWASNQDITVDITNSTFSGNFGFNGSAIESSGFYSGDVVNLTINNSTFADNSSTIGAALQIDGNTDADVTNTIFSGNEIQGGSNCYVGSYETTTSGANNLATDSSCSDFSATVTNVAEMDLDPLTGSAPYYFGLGNGSAALNVGSSCEATDQIGTDRTASPYGSAGCDIGAIERIYGNQTSPFVVTTTEDLDNESCTDISCSLRDAIFVSTSGDEINFHSDLSGQIITLSSQLVISKNLTIDGSDLDQQVLLSGNNSSRIFNVPSGGYTVNIDSLKLTNGYEADGGAILAVAATLNINNSTFDNNTAAYGGVMYLDYGASATVTNSTFTNNHAFVRGGVLVGGAGAYPTLQTAKFVNSTFSGNSSDDGGGVVQVYVLNVTFINSTLSGNSASGDGGVINDTAVDTNIYLYNTIVANSTGGGCVGTLDGQSNNLFDDASNSCGVTDGLNNSIVGSDALLYALSDSGSDPQTFGLQLDSPAIDAGDTTTCNGADVNALDQRGVARPSGFCDIGSFENQQIGTTTEIVNLSSPTFVNVPITVSVEVTQNSGNDPVSSVDITGADTNCTINNLSPVGGKSVGSCNVIFSSTGNKTLTATYNGDFDHLGSTSSGEGLTVTAPPLTATFKPNGNHDGWVLESGKSTSLGGSLNKDSASLRVGDDSKNKKYISVLSFDTSKLPNNAVITSATLKVKKSSVTGNPTGTLGSLALDIKSQFFGSSLSLSIHDYQAAAGQSGIGTFGAPTLGWYSISINSGALVTINLTGYTQFRLYFATDDDNDFLSDYLSFFSGNAANVSNRPILEINYYLP